MSSITKICIIRVITLYISFLEKDNITKREQTNRIFQLNRTNLWKKKKETNLCSVICATFENFFFFSPKYMD